MKFIKTFLREITVALFILISMMTSYASVQPTFRFHIEWKNSNIRGEITATNGKINKITVSKGTIKGNSFHIPVNAKARLTVEVSDYNNAPGPDPTVISVKTSGQSFSFFLRDIHNDCPVFIPDYNVVILAEEENRSFTEIGNDIAQRNNLTKIQRIENEEEASFEAAALATRNMSVPVLLGISRDMRLFEISEELEDMAQEGKIIRPRYASTDVGLPDSDNRAYLYALWRGVWVRNNIIRR